MSEILENQTVVKKQRRRLYFLAKRLKRPFISIGYISIVLLIGFLTWFGLTLSPHFALKKIEVVGSLHLLNAEEIIKASQVSLGINLFKIPLKGVEENISKLKWVHSCFIRRQVPDTLWIHVREQTPKAILLADKLMFVSEEGKVFKEVEKEPTRDLPVLTGFQKGDSLEEAIQLVHFFEARSDFNVFGLSEIHYNEAQGFSIVTLKGPMEVKFGRKNFDAKLTRLKAILVEVKPKLGKIRGIDLDYEDRAFVKL